MRSFSYVLLPVAFAVTVFNWRTAEPPTPPTIAARAKLEVAYDETETIKRFFEGPSYDPTTDTLYFTAFGKDNTQMLKMDSAGQVSVFLDHTDGINGTFLSRPGGLIACQGEKGRVVRIPFTSHGGRSEERRVGKDCTYGVWQR